MAPARPSADAVTGVADAAAAEPFRLACCPACGYSLNGLPDAGTCPECGRAYDDRTIVLYGWARGDRAGIVNARPWVVPLLLLFHGAWFVTVAIDAIVGVAAPTPSTLVALAVWVFLAVWVLWKRWSIDAPGLIQVHLSREGCQQLDAAFPRPNAAPTPWKDVHTILAEPAGMLGSGRVRIKLAQHVAWWSRSGRTLTRKSVAARSTSPHSELGSSSGGAPLPRPPGVASGTACL